MLKIVLNVVAAALMMTATVSCDYSVGTDVGNTSHSIIPKPSQIDIHSGKVDLTSLSTICYDSNDENIKAIVDFLNEKIAPAAGFALSYNDKHGDVNLVYDKSLSLVNEAYMLSVDSKGINIASSSYSGLFYGVQTLLQLMPSDVKSKTKVPDIALYVPYCKISDAPEFQWRGLMLDVSRHWFTKDEVKRYIDQLAEAKMNIFHWHLTDDQGWRIEIKSRPELTAKGALRAPRVGQWWQREPQKAGEVSTYGGFYTQEEIKEVLEYAAKRYVRVIPEIDVPGHSLATLVAYPELACFRAPTAVNVGNKFYTIDENSLCVGNPESYKLMEDVLKEVSQLFSDEYIHIGGDECWKGFWERCPKCRSVMREQGLKNVNELQSYFIRRMESVLKANGKKLIGWDEISEGGLAPEATVMSWRGMQGGIDAAKAGHHVIMTPNDHCYIDLYQGDPAGEPDTYSMCRLSDSYAFEPVPSGVKKELILGGQGNLWAESVPTMRHAEYMTWPRGWAIAEVLWSGTKTKDWNNFVKRVEKQFERADKAEINHARSMYNPIVSPYEDENGNILIELSSEIEGLDLHYTFDNTSTDNFTPKYEGLALSIPDGATWFKVVSCRDGKAIGKELVFEISKMKEKSKGQKRVIGNLTI